jgi:hypothetical protein
VLIGSAFDESVPVLGLDSVKDVLDYLRLDENLSILSSAGAIADILERLPDATVIVVERDYYDPDARSEQHRLVDRLSSLPRFDTPRLHFFSPDVTTSKQI